jgi:aldehyde dehydrogenase (NAD+)
MNMMTELAGVKLGAPLRADMRIAGEHVGSDRVIEVRNPYTKAIVGTVPKATIADLRRAFAIAKSYRSKLTRFERAQIMYRTAELIRTRADAISDLITAESGLCKKDSTYEVGRACDVFTFAGNAALQTTARCSCDLTPHGKSRKVYTLRDRCLAPSGHPPSTTR